MATTTAIRTNETVRKQIKAVNAHDVKTFVALYADSAEVFDPAYGEPLRGTSAIEKDMNDFVKAFPDLEMELQRSLESGNEAAYEVTMRGTHKGPLVGPTGTIPATDRRIEISGAIITRFGADGKIAEERRYYDLARLLEQVGLLQ